jgi:hypothetical protein
MMMTLAEEEEEEEGGGGGGEEEGGGCVMTPHKPFSSSSFMMATGGGGGAGGAAATTTATMFTARGVSRAEEAEEIEMLATLSPEEHEELMRYIEDALQEEMRAAEEMAFEEYSQLENHEIEASVEHLYDYDALPPDDAVTVLCPCCKENYLLHGGTGEDVLCTCGLRLDGGNSELTLALLQERLAAVYAQHKAICVVKEPTFFQRGPCDLWVECLTCGLSAPVL